MARQPSGCWLHRCGPSRPCRAGRTRCLPPGPSSSPRQADRLPWVALVRHLLLLLLLLLPTRPPCPLLLPPSPLLRPPCPCQRPWPPLPGACPPRLPRQPPTPPACHPRHPFLPRPPATLVCLHRLHTTLPLACPRPLACHLHQEHTLAPPLLGLLHLDLPGAHHHPQDGVLRQACPDRHQACRPLQAGDPLQGACRHRPCPPHPDNAALDGLCCSCQHFFLAQISQVHCCH
mmetsp:Transcript_3721/g.10100  ORF Transcript_3721/g.10100 Transcript_3721/m.10100 type:complete len:232 (-) Transcript_3721:476-1171(-)